MVKWNTGEIEAYAKGKREGEEWAKLHMRTDKAEEVFKAAIEGAAKNGGSHSMKVQYRKGFYLAACDYLAIY